MAALRDSLVRAVGADPAVFRPVARAHALIAMRRTRGLATRARARGGFLLWGLSAFHFRCLTFTFLGVLAATFVLGARSPILGALVALTLGAGFIAFDVLVDESDVLVNHDEYLVLASHPHDDWSLLAAKMFVTGRAIAVLAFLVLAPPAAAVGFALHSTAAAIAYLSGGAALTLVVAGGGMLFAAGVVAGGGRGMLDRVMPIAQIGYTLVYFLTFSNRRFLERMQAPDLAALGVIQWLLPTAWFLAPVELTLGHVTQATLIRAALAGGLVLVVGVGGARWIGTRFGAKMLEPPVRRRAARSTARALDANETKVAARWGSPASRAFRRLLFLHLKSDQAFRGAVIGGVVPTLAILISGQAGGASWMRGTIPIILMSSIMFILSIQMITWAVPRSTRPAAVWPALVAPGGRLALSLSVASTFRWLIIAPVFALGMACAMIFGGGPWEARLALTAIAWLLCDWAVLFTRGLNPEIPFSQSIQSGRRFTWARVIGFFGSLFFTGGVLLLLVIFARDDRWAWLVYAVALLWLLAARFLTEMWMKARVRRGAESLELTGE